jgi:hypothetical protein
LVDGIAVVGRDEVRPPSLSLLGAGRPGDHPETPGSHLNLHCGLGQEILVPGWVMGPTTVRGDDHIATSLLQVEQRDSVILTGAVSPGGQEQYVVVDETTTDQSPGEAI